MNEIAEFIIGLLIGAVAASIIGGGFALWTIVSRLEVLASNVGSIAHAIYAVEKAIKKSTDQ